MHSTIRQFSTNSIQLLLQRVLLASRYLQYVIHHKSITKILTHLSSHAWKHSDMPATYNDYQPCMATKYESFELPTIQLIKYKQSVYT